MNTLEKWLASLFEPSGPGDTLEQAQVRAYGVDPLTGALIAPQYAGAAAAAGYNPSNPAAFVNSIEAQVKSQYQADFAGDFDELGGFTLNPFANPDGSVNWTKFAVVGAVIIAAVILIGKAL